MTILRLFQVIEESYFSIDSRGNLKRCNNWNFGQQVHALSSFTSAKIIVTYVFVESKRQVHVHSQTCREIAQCIEIDYPSVQGLGGIWKAEKARPFTFTISTQGLEIDTVSGHSKTVSEYENHFGIW